ncbi:MAG TPA: alpha/beta fold hydrolase [Xanthobacteraceae bacterium]|nr:alpha/beta fold hydrolase [Xanthobacteraceae bacterium]
MKKWMRGLVPGALIGLSLAAGVVAGPVVLMPGPVDLEGSESRRQLWLLPSQDPAVPMLTTVFRPPGEGPFPMVLMNHGTTRNALERTYFPLLEFNAAALWFAERKYAVVAPQRPGHGDTGGAYFEEVAPCEDPTFREAGLAVAEADRAALDYMAPQPFIQSEGIIVVGQSAGGFGSLALMSQNPPGVRGMINFAGGRTCRDGPQWPERLAETASEFCRTARIPMLWIYTQNDLFFPPAVSKPMFEACRAAGADVEYHLLPPFEDNGHYLVDVPKAIPIWAPIVTKFLAAHPAKTP